MEGAEELIRTKIRHWNRGRIFFADDFTGIATQESVRQALCALTDEKYIIRIARGVYCFPKLSGETNIYMLLPSPTDIAESVAARSRSRIVPDGAHAAYESGISDVRQTVLTYLSDGAPRKINLSNGVKIIFKHTSESKIFAFRNAKFQRLCLGIRYLGAERMASDDVRRIIRYRLSEIPEDDFSRDITLTPAWVQEILLDIWNS